MQLPAREMEFAGQACGGITFGDTAQQQHQGRRALAGLGERGIGQQRVIAVTITAAIGGKVALLPEEAPPGAPAVGADEAVGVEVALQPEQA